jgi:hypothetical protein
MFKFPWKLPDSFKIISDNLGLLHLDIPFRARKSAKFTIAKYIWTYIIQSQKLENRNLFTTCESGHKNFKLPKICVTRTW